MQVNSPSIIRSDKSESIFLPLTGTRDRGSSSETGSGKGTRSVYSRLLFPAISCTKKEKRKLRPVIDLSLLKQYIREQNGDSQIGTSVVISSRLDCLHRLDKCLSTCSDSFSILKVSSAHVQRSSLSVHSLTFRNDPKLVDFYQTDGRYSIAHVPTCHPGISIPRRLAYKRSNSQPTNISHQILSTNCTNSRFHSKSKEVRFDTSPEIYVYRDGICDTTEYSQGTTGPSQILTSDCWSFSFPNSSFSTNFPFSFGLTQCSSRFSSPRQTTLTSTSDVSFICLETTHSSDRSLHSDKQHDSIPLKTNRFALGTSIHSPEPNTFLFTDASHFGWGAHLEPMRLAFHYGWSEDQSQLHINMLEMMSICLALKKAIKYIQHSCVMRRGMENPPLVS